MATEDRFYCILEQPSETEVHNRLKYSTYDPKKYTIDSHILIVSICIGKSIRIQRVEVFIFVNFLQWNKHARFVSSFFQIR